MMDLKFACSNADLPGTHYIFFAWVLQPAIREVEKE